MPFASLRSLTGSRFMIIDVMLTRHSLLLTGTNRTSKTSSQQARNMCWARWHVDDTYRNCSMQLEPLAWLGYNSYYK